MELAGQNAQFLAGSTKRAGFLALLEKNPGRQLMDSAGRAKKMEKREGVQVVTDEDRPTPKRKFTIFGREIALPQSKAKRVAIGSALLLGGVLGFLPILGFWMVPLGLLVLSYEFAWVR